VLFNPSTPTTSSPAAAGTSTTVPGQSAPSPLDRTRGFGTPTSPASPASPVVPKNRIMSAPAAGSDGTVTQATYVAEATDAGGQWKSR
jgi:hypothetical protein